MEEHIHVSVELGIPLTPKYHLWIHLVLRSYKQSNSIDTTYMGTERLSKGYCFC